MLHRKMSSDLYSIGVYFPTVVAKIVTIHKWHLLAQVFVLANLKFST